MSLRDEVKEIMGEQLAQDPTWSKLGEDPPVVIIPVMGNVEETLQTLTNAFTTLSGALLSCVLHIADAVDDLREDAAIQKNG
jgi:hypothetical protein